MNEQQLAAVKQALEALQFFKGLSLSMNEIERAEQAITTLQSIISQDALHKMAEESRTSGLRLDDWDKIGCVNHDCDKCKAVQEPVAWTDLLKQAEEVVRSKSLWKKYIDGTPLANDIAVWMANFAQEHTTPPAAQPAPVQEKNQSPYPEYDRGFSNGWDRGFAAAQPAPVQEPEYWNVIDPAGNSVASETNAIRGWARIAGSYKPTVEGLLGFHDQGWRVLPKATPQPVPVKTYHDGKPWPVAPKPWVGLSEEEVEAYDDWADFQVGCGRQTLFDMVRNIEAKLKEKNHD